MNNFRFSKKLKFPSFLYLHFSFKYLSCFISHKLKMDELICCILKFCMVFKICLIIIIESTQFLLVYLLSMSSSASMEIVIELLLAKTFYYDILKVFTLVYLMLQIIIIKNDLIRHTLHIHDRDDGLAFVEVNHADVAEESVINIDRMCCQ